MEKSALVIIDFGDAIREGYVEFNNDVEQLYTREILAREKKGDEDVAK